MKPRRYRVTEMIQRYGCDDEVINAALDILRRRMRQPGAALSSPNAVRTYLQLQISALPFEAFWTCWLDCQNRVIALQEAFRGSLSSTSVFPREILKKGLELNAGAVIFAHNHPSGVAEPSRADESLTQTLKHTLSLCDIKVLDHFIVGSDATMSFAERGLL